MAADQAQIWTIVSVVLGGSIATATALVTQRNANEASRRLERFRLQSAFLIEDYKGIPASQIRDASRILEQQLLFAKNTIARLARDQRTGRRSITWSRTRDLFAVAYDVHAPKATALRLCNLYEDRAESAMRHDPKIVATLWPIVELLNELFERDAEVAAIDPPIAGYQRLAPGEQPQYLPADVFAKLMIGSQGVASRGAFEQRLSNGNQELMRALLPSRRAFADFSPQSSPVLWRVLLCEAMLADVVSALRSDEGPDGAQRVMNAWPSTPSRELLRWSDDDGACDAEFAAACTAVRQRFGELVKSHLPPMDGDDTLGARWSRPAGSEQAKA